MKCFAYNLTDLTTFESPRTKVWIDWDDLQIFASRVAREMLVAVPDLTNKAMCVGNYDNEGEAISYLRWTPFTEGQAIASESKDAAIPF